LIENELIFLGLLKERPKHGYEIKKEIKEVLSVFAGTNLKSIYYPLRMLEQSGLVEKNSAKVGKRPVRFVYKLTSKGESKFNELLNKSLLSFRRPQFSLDLSLYFLKHIKPAIAKRRLRARLLILKKLSKELRVTINSLKNKNPPVLSLSNILEHNLGLLEAESKFLAGLTGVI
jgi:DNA-binding PadR family transcriptional regulator